MKLNNNKKHINMGLSLSLNRLDNTETEAVNTHSLFIPVDLFIK